MKRALFLLAVLSVFLSIQKAEAQYISEQTNTVSTPNEFYLQVKQFGEFIERFNYKTDWEGNKVDGNFESNYPRKTYLNFLINSEDSRLSNDTDSTYRLLCDSFINDVVSAESPLNISLYSGQVTAKALVNIKYLGKNQTIKVLFMLDVLSDRSAKWVISSVEAKCFNNVSDSLKTYFISPNSHETNFINMKRIENLSNPVYFMADSFTSNATILFMTEIAANRLIISNIEKVTYLVSFPNWQITVDEFIRTGYNSGWLISNVAIIN